jgi:hypothetical protein
MSRIDELKKQHPYFDLSYFDFFKRIDPTKSGKYIPVFSKVISNEIEKRIENMDDYDYPKYITEKLKNYNFDCSNLTLFELFIANHLTDVIGESQLISLTEFVEYMERGLVDNKDVLTYKNIDDVRGAISLASLKEHSKDLESQIHKEYEDDNWLIVRPLSFESSSKYGSGTKWCTTYKKEKEYFAKYFSRGVLVYFINKKTGYKFAMYAEVYEGDNEISFWTADDNRVDFLSVDIDYNLLPLIKKLSNSKIKNSDLLSEEERDKVQKDCNYIVLKGRDLLEPQNNILTPEENYILYSDNQTTPTINFNYEVGDVDAEIN